MVFSLSLLLLVFFVSLLSTNYLEGDSCNRMVNTLPGRRTIASSYEDASDGYLQNTAAIQSIVKQNKSDLEITNKASHSIVTMIPSTISECIGNCSGKNSSQKKELYNQEESDLEAVIRKQVFNNSIMVYLTDSGYLTLFLNAYYVSNLRNYPNVVVVCQDRPCYIKLKKIGIAVALLNAKNVYHVKSDVASSFGTQAFIDKVQWKFIIWKRALKMNIRVLYIDSDIILLKDPFPYLYSLKGYDIIAQRDITLCSGFMLMNPTPRTKKAVEKASKMRLNNPKAEDQTSLIRAINAIPNFKLFLLPLHIFSSGGYFFGRHSYYWDPIPRHQIMIHNNYVIGTNNKLLRFKEMKMYLLDIDGEYSNPNAKYLTIEHWSM